MIKQRFECKQVLYSATQLEIARKQLEKEISWSMKDFIRQIGKMPKVDTAITFDNKFFSISVVDEDFLEPTD